MVLLAPQPSLHQWIAGELEARKGLLGKDVTENLCSSS